MQREREAEGDLYMDKESFVTQAYKDQMEEVRKAEEEEKKREGEYQNLLQSTYLNYYTAHRIAQKAGCLYDWNDPFLPTVTRRFFTKT